MRKIVSLLLALFLAAGLFIVPVSASDGEDGTGEILVKFKAKTTGNEISALNRSQKATEKAEIKALGVKVLKVKNPKAIAALYKNNKHVEYAEVNEAGSLELTPNDTNYKVRLTNIAKALNAEAGWDIITESDVLIAVIDSGVASHADLGATVAGHSPFDGTTNTTDVNGHGTGVAGVLGARGNNGVGTTGINWNANIMPLKVAGASNSVLVSNVASALVFAADNGARVINMSLSFSVDSKVLKEAIDYAHGKGCLLVAATGNGGASAVNYPAAYSNVLAVGSTGDGTSRYFNSNYGDGIGVLGYNSYYTLSKSGGYGTLTGTSFATPQVSALASLVWKLAPDLSNDQVAELIYANARDVGAAGYDKETGYGIIDIGKTLAAANNGEVPKTPDASSSSSSSSTVIVSSSEPEVSSIPDSSEDLPPESTSEPITVPVSEPEPTAPEQPAPPQTVTEREKVALSGTVGKKSGTATHRLSALAAGDIDISINFGGKKNLVSATLLNKDGESVASNEGGTSFTIKAAGVAAGDYTLQITEKSGANNVSYTGEALMPEVTYEIINDEKVPLGQLESSPNYSLIWILSALVLAAAITLLLLVRRKRKGSANSGK